MSNANSMRLVLLCCGAFCLISLRASADTNSKITYEELKTLSGIQLKLHPQERPLIERVVAKYGKQSTYTASQIDPLMAGSEPAQAEAGLAAPPHLKPRPARTEMEPAAQAHLKPRPAQAEVEPAAPMQLKPRPAQGWDVITHAVTHPKLRQNYTDVLPGEDPSQQDLAAGKFDDLNGASLSYTRDSKADTDTWSAKAALIMPMVWDGNLAYGFKPVFYGIVPSVSLDRVDTNGDPKDATDLLTYRAGAFAQWLVAGGRGEKLHARLNARGSFTYVTDTQNDLQLPAGEFDVEPQIFYGPNWALGYLFNPFVGEQSAIDPNLAHFQVRAWMHGEYGTVESSSKQVGLARDRFFRVGPILALKIEVPKFPVIGKQFSLNVEYHYLPTLSGSGDHDSLLKIGGELTLIDGKEGKEGKEGGPRITLKADYTKGGLDLTKQDVDTFTLGLGVLF